MTSSADELRSMAKEAYIYGFPMVDSYRIQYSYFVDKGDPEYKVPWNQIYHTACVYAPADKAVQHRTPIRPTLCWRHQFGGLLPRN